MKDSEKYMERYLKVEIERKQGLCLKWVSPGTNGVPDRIVLMPNGKIYFIELKTLGQTPRKIQEVVHRMIRSKGFEVLVIDSFIKLKQFLDAV